MIYLSVIISFLLFVYSLVILDSGSNDILLVTIMLPSLYLFYLWKVREPSDKFIIISVVSILLITSLLPLMIYTSSYKCEGASSFDAERVDNVPVRVVWCDDIDGIIGNKAGVTASTLDHDTNIGDIWSLKIRDKVFLDREKIDNINNRVIMHELGHSIGLGHTEDFGLMYPSLYGVQRHSSPTEGAIKVAKSFEAYEYISWDSREDYLFLKKEHEKGNLSESAMEWVESKYNKSSGEDIYYRHFFDDIGGVKDISGDSINDRFYSKEMTS
jgi:hypothetical protein